MGLGWSADQALDTPLPLCALAIRGRVEMLESFGEYLGRMFFGTPDAPPEDKPQNVASQVNDIFGRMMGED